MILGNVSRIRLIEYIREFFGVFSFDVCHLQAMMSHKQARRRIITGRKCEDVQVPSTSLPGFFGSDRKLNCIESGTKRRQSSSFSVKDAKH
jgi:hypothetical protein